MSNSEAQSTLQPGQRIKPNVSVNQAKKLVEEYYELQVESIRELNSYDDNNFYVKGTSKDGKQCKAIFKVLNSMDSRKTGHIEAEHAIMQRLSENGINCTVPLKNVRGDTFELVTIQSESKDLDNNESKPTQSDHIIRLLSFVEGKIMYDVPPTAKLLQKAGKYIAQVENILQDLSFAALDNHSSVWMLSHCMDLDRFIYVIKNDTEHYKLAYDVLAAYKSQVVPMIPQLEKGTCTAYSTGILHGDFNEQNIIVSPSSSDIGEYDVSGVIDFGDLQVDAYVFELAITICYMMLECAKEGSTLDVFEGAQNVLKGYSSVRQLTDNELKVLRILIACRLCQSLVMGAYSYSLDPGNEYLLTTAKTGWSLLEKLWNEKTDEEMVACWKAAVAQ